MSIKFSRTAPNPRTRIVIPDSPTSTIPAGDFLIGSVVTLDGTWPPTENNHILTAINSSDVEPGNLRLFLRSDATADCGGDVYPGSGIDARNPTVLVAGSSYFVGMARVGTQLRTVVCPVLTAQPIDGSAVVFSTKTRNITTGEMNPPPFVIGERSSAVQTTGDRRFDNSISRVICIAGSVPALDIAKIAYGMEPADLGYTPLWYVRMNDGMDTTDLGPNALATTRSTGADPLPTGTSPGFGFVSTNRPPTVTPPVINGSLQVGTAVAYTSGLIDGYPFPVSTQQWYVDGVAITGATGLTYIPTANDELKTLTVRQFVKSAQGEAFAFSAGKTIAAAVDALYLTPPPADWMVQQIGGVAPVPFSFTYTGEQPASIEYALFDPDGTPRVTWTAAGATIVPGGTGSAIPSMPAGAKKYLLAIRAKRSNDTIIATSATSATRFGVGEVIGMVGSSSAETWGYRITGTVDTEICAQFRDGAWYIPDRETYATKMARYIHSQRGFVVGMIDAGAGGTGLSGTTGWVSKTSSMWMNFESAVAKSGGKLGGLAVSVGSNDAGSGGVILKSVHAASMRTLIQNARDLTGQPNLPVLWSGYNRRSADLAKPNFNASSDAVREAEKLVGTDPYVYHVQALDYELHADGVHLTGPGFLDCTARMAYVWCEALAGRYRRGPKITAFSFAGNDVFIDVTHRNGTDLSPATGGVGVTVTDASGSPVQVSAQRVSATRYSVTYDRPLVAPVTTKFLSGGAPDWLTPIMDNGAVPLPMEVETEMATVAASTTEPLTDTTLPVMAGSVSASSVTATSATLAWPAATDDVGIASYEYSLDGGTNYINVGTDRTVTRSNLTASTNYPVRVRAKDAAGNAAVPLQYSLTTIAALDTTAPAMTGSISTANVTTAGATISWPAATDVVGVVGYEYSINGGTTYIDVGAARTVTVSGRPASTLHQVRVRAYDAAGNRATPLSASFTTLAAQPAQNAVVGSTVAESRRVAFPGGTRVVAFGTVPGAVTPNAPYLESGKWWSEKHPLDERYWVANITVDLDERATTATSVAVIVAGVTVLEQPVIQGKLIPVKLGGFNAAAGAANFCTFRVTCANSERFDRTIWFKQQVGSWSLEKDADDESYFVADISNDLADSNTTASAVLAQPVGVSVLVAAVIQGPLILVKLGGMDTLPAGVNYCDLRIDCANSERFYRTIQFNRVDN